MKKEKQIMISLVMQLFKVQEAKEVLATLIFHHLFLIFLKMYLEILEILVLEDSLVEEDQEIGATI
jgi:hypothetical protein